MTTLVQLRDKALGISSFEQFGSGQNYKAIIDHTKIDENTLNKISYGLNLLHTFVQIGGVKQPRFLHNLTNELNDVIGSELTTNDTFQLLEIILKNKSHFDKLKNTDSDRNITCDLNEECYSNDTEFSGGGDGSSISDSISDSWNKLKRKREKKKNQKDKISQDKKEARRNKKEALSDKTQESIDSMRSSASITKNTLTNIIGWDGTKTPISVKMFDILGLITDIIASSMVYLPGNAKDNKNISYGLFGASGFLSILSSIVLKFSKTDLPPPTRFKEIFFTGLNFIPIIGPSLGSILKYGTRASQNIKASDNLTTTLGKKEEERKKKNDERDTKQDERNENKIKRKLERQCAKYEVPGNACNKDTIEKMKKYRNIKNRIGFTYKLYENCTKFGIPQDICTRNTIKSYQNQDQEDQTSQENISEDESQDQ